MKLKNIISFVLCFIIAFSAFFAQASDKLESLDFIEAASGKTYKYIFDDDISSNSRIFGSGTYSGTTTADKYKGTGSYRITITQAGERSYTNIAREIFQGLDSKNAALEFYYKPLVARDEVYVGISCFTDSQTNKNAVLRISLKNYLDLENYNFESGEWLKVLIPFEYFVKNGEFVNLGEVEMTGFDFNRLNGVYFEYSKENLDTEKLRVAYVDEIKVSEYVNAPEILGSSFADGVTLYWENLGENTEYEVYKNGYFKARVKENHYFDPDCKKNRTYEYKVRAKRSGMVSLPNTYTADTNFITANGASPDNKLGVKNAVCYTDGGKAMIWFDKSCAENMTYMLYKNGSAYAKSDGEFFIDNSYSDGDVYKIISYSADKTRVSAVANVEVKNDGFSTETKNVKLLDKNGAAAKNSAVSSVSFDVENKSADFGALAVAAFYKDGHLNSADVENITLKPGNNSFEIKLANPPVLNGEYDFKVFVLDNLSALEPFAPKSALKYTKLSGDGTYDVVLNNSDEKQTVTGWGISPFSMRDFRNFQTVSDWKEVFDLTYKDLGINIIRLPFNADCGDGDGNINESELAILANYVKCAQEYGITDYMMTYWSAPDDMIEIEEGGITYGDGNCERLKVDCEEKYCDYIVKCVSYLNENCNNLPVALSFQNEPQDGRTMPRYDSEQYMRVSKLLRNKLDNAGFEKVLIMGPETAAYYQMYIQMGGKIHNLQFTNFAEDKDFADAIGVIGVHSYAMKVGDRSYHSDIEQFNKAASDYPEKERWQTEFSESNSFETNIDSSIYTMRILSADVGWAGMNKWFYWRSYFHSYTLDENGITYDIYNTKYSQQSLLIGPPKGKLKTTKLYNSLQTLFLNAPAGSKVITADCSDENVDNASALFADLLAFKTEKGSTVMLINKSEEDKIYNFSNLIGEKAVVKYVCEDNEDIVTTDEIEIKNGRISGICLPKKSIMYVISK